MNKHRSPVESWRDYRATWAGDCGHEARNLINVGPKQIKLCDVCLTHLEAEVVLLAALARAALVKGVEA